MARKITVNTNPVAANYASTGEKIIEYSGTFNTKSGDIVGGLISIREIEDPETGEKVLRVELYRHNKEVQIMVGKGE